MAALTASLVAGRAEAVPAEVRLQISPKPVRQALIDFALQADVSLGGALDACRGLSPGLSGKFRIDAALSRLLARSGCAYSLQDSRAVLILAEPSRTAPRVTPIPAARPDRPAAIGEIVVTAQRYPNLPGRTPYAISALSDNSLRRDGILDLQGLASEVAGMTVTNLGPGRDKILLRGLSDGAFTGQAQSIVALYLDDAPMTYSAPDPDLRLADVERVEVMRGPQGTLYGGGSIGGVVRIVTRKPNLDRFSGGLTLGLGSTDGGRDTEMEGVLNLPLVAGRVAVRGVAYRDTQSGQIDNVGLGLSDVNASRRYGGRVAVLANLVPGWTAMAGVIHQSIINDDTQYALRRLPQGQRDNAVREPHDNDFDETSLSLAGDGAWGRIAGSLVRIGHQYVSRYDATAAIARFAGPAGPAAFDEDRRVELTVAEATYASPADRPLHGLAGVFFSTGETKLDTVLGPAPSPSSAPVYAEARVDRIKETAIYGEATWDITPKLSATVGLRWFDFRFDTVSDVRQPAGRQAFADGADASGWSPKFLLSYLARPGALIYAQASEGYRPGGFNTSGQIGQTFDQAGFPRRQYQSDELWSYEVGVKFRGFDDRLQTRIAAFHATWQSVQSDQFLADGLAFTTNIGDGANSGLEVEAAWRVNNDLDLRGSALINDPEITHRSPDVLAKTDAGLPGVSRASAGIVLDYHRPLGGAYTLRLVGQSAYIGTSHLTFDAAHSNVMGDYVTLRGSIALEADSWSLSASLENPFNATSNSFSFGSPFLIGQEQVVTPVRPRTVAVRLTGRF
ncbi:TonB-dependent receptor [Phenylobacterium sp.]|uniref:TonB-dependent receptor n=1 Tax=Phenylobacterium sp. TaxID=1871053 RepID=UPI00286B8804|nr:TonB-dependent receptor [Phenylobacterium sp.]